MWLSIKLTFSTLHLLTLDSKCTHTHTCSHSPFVSLLIHCPNYHYLNDFSMALSLLSLQRLSLSCPPHPLSICSPVRCPEILTCPLLYHTQTYASMTRVPSWALVVLYETETVRKPSWNLERIRKGVDVAKKNPKKNRDICFGVCGAWMFFFFQPTLLLLLLHPFHSPHLFSLEGTLLILY